MVGYYFQGSNFDLEHLTMYDVHGNEIAVLKSNDKRLMGGIPFVSPTIEIMADAPLLLEEVKRLRKTIEDIENTAQDYDHPEVEEIISMCLWVMEPDSAGYNSKIPWKNVHSGDD